MFLCSIFVLDLDNDGVIGWEEAVKYGTDPTPLVGYDDNLWRLKYVVDLVDAGLMPSDVRELHSKDEIKTIQTNLITAILEDHVISETELTVLDELVGLRSRWRLRWWIVRDILASGMINDDNLQENWDGDSSSNGSQLLNYAEIMQGTNPLEDLETSPDDLSDRYVIITDVLGWSWQVAEVEAACEVLLKNGYTDDNIYLTLNPGNETVRILHSYPVEVDHLGASYERSTGLAFLNNIRDLPSDGNDLVLVYSASHGNPGSIRIGGSVGVAELHETLSEMRYGEAITIISCCEAGGFVRRLGDNPVSLENMLGVAAIGENEYSGIDFLISFVKYMDFGFSVEEGIDILSEYCWGGYNKGYCHHEYNPGVKFGSPENFSNPLKYVYGEASHMYRLPNDQ